MKCKLMLIIGAMIVQISMVCQAEIKIVTGHNGNQFASSDFKFKDVPQPARNDAATKATFTVVDGRRDRNGGDLDKLHDGQIPSEGDQPSENFFFSAGTEGGRILIDLGDEWKASLEKRIAAEAKPLLSASDPGLFSKHLADYDSELRRPDGRVDIDAMVSRLKELGVTTYYWLIWHAPTDWEDLKLLLPKAAEAGIDVWVYLVPPSESAPRYGTRYPEPFRLDYHRWAEEIARLSLRNDNLIA